MTGTYWNFDKTTFYLNFQLSVSFSLALVLKCNSCYLSRILSHINFFQNLGNLFAYLIKRNWAKLWSWKQFYCKSFQQKIYLLRFHFYNKQIFEGHKRSGPSRGRRNGGSYFKIPSKVILIACKPISESFISQPNPFPR